jgi:Outer membrane lipoprotein carrier protein LolA-like
MMRKHFNLRRARLLRVCLAAVALGGAGFAGAGPALSAADNALLQKVSARLATDTAVDQQFVQEKHLRVLKRPIRTEGVMLYRREQGVCWHTQKPVTSTLVLGEQQLRQINGSDQLVVKAEQQPALFGFTRLFFAALSGQVQTLAEHFELRVSGSEQHWQLDLTPRDALLHKFIEGMQLRGGARVEQVQVAGHDGDITDIQFAPLSAAAGDAAALEQHCFVQ